MKTVVLFLSLIVFSSSLNSQKSTSIKYELVSAGNKDLFDDVNRFSNYYSYFLFRFDSLKSILNCFDGCFPHILDSIKSDSLKKDMFLPIVRDLMKDTNYTNFLNTVSEIVGKDKFFDKNITPNSFEYDRLFRNLYCRDFYYIYKNKIKDPKQYYKINSKKLNDSLISELTSNNFQSGIEGLTEDYTGPLIYLYLDDIEDSVCALNAFYYPVFRKYIFLGYKGYLYSPNEDRDDYYCFLINDGHINYVYKVIKSDKDRIEFIAIDNFNVSYNIFDICGDNVFYRRYEYDLIRDMHYSTDYYLVNKKFFHYERKRPNNSASVNKRNKRK